MPKRLDDLYHSFFKQQDFNELKLSVEENHKLLIDRLSKEDRKTVLRIMDALSMICNYQSKASFIQGFGLGMELATELKNYDHSLEEILNDCGHNFLCRRENPMTKKKAKIIAVASVAVISLLIISIPNHSSQEPPISEVRPVSPSFTNGRDNVNKAVVADKSAKVSTQNPPQDSALTENDFEPPSKADSKEILTESSTPRDNPTPTPAPSKSKTTATASEPKMGDTRTVDGKKQVYFLGFGWIDDNDEPNQCIYVEDMYENGNKIGSMGGTFVDGEGDINKMVGIMD